MIQNGMMFGGEGPIMQGTWYNPHTGDAFTVRDSFFEDNQYTVTTTDGRYLKYNQLQNYIQSDMKLEDLKKMKAEKTANNVKEEIPAEIASLIAEDDPYSAYMIPEDDIRPQLGNIYEAPMRPTASVDPGIMHAHTTAKTASMNEAIIEKALKNTSRPEFNVDVIWDHFPTKEIEMLKDIMDIPEQEILDWYLDNIEMMDVVDALKTAIRNKILTNQLVETEKQIRKVSDNTVTTMSIEDELPAVEKPVKKTSKTTKKTTKK